MHVYETTHPVAHTADDMFALVARVEDYPKFLPLCEAVEIKRREMGDGKEVIVATMTVGYGLSAKASPPRCISTAPRRKFSSSISMGRSRSWKTAGTFSRAAARACDVEFYIAYAFSSRLFERLVGRLFAKAVERYTSAFEARADAVYGRKHARFTPVTARDRSRVRRFAA